MYRRRITKSNEVRLEIEKYVTRKKKRTAKGNVKKRKSRKKEANKFKLLVGRKVVEDEYMHRRKLRRKQIQGSPPKFRELCYLKHVFGKKARKKGKIVYSSHQEREIVYKYTQTGHWMPLGILILCHLFFLTGGRAVHISLLCCMWCVLYTRNVWY